MSEKLIRLQNKNNKHSYIKFHMDFPCHCIEDWEQVIPRRRRSLSDTTSLYEAFLDIHDIVKNYYPLLQHENRNETIEFLKDFDRIIFKYMVDAVVLEKTNTYTERK